MNREIEPLFDNGRIVIPLADVQHVERVFSAQTPENARVCRGASIITRHTRWSFEADYWDNALWINQDELNLFINEWTQFRLERDGAILTDPPKEAQTDGS